MEEIWNGKTNFTKVNILTGKYISCVTNTVSEVTFHLKLTENQEIIHRVTYKTVKKT